VTARNFCRRPCSGSRIKCTLAGQVEDAELFLYRGNHAAGHLPESLPPPTSSSSSSVAEPWPSRAKTHGGSPDGQLLLRAKNPTMNMRSTPRPISTGSRSNVRPIFLSSLSGMSSPLLVSGW
jgi:hypothetical protein